MQHLRMLNFFLFFNQTNNKIYDLRNKKKNWWIRTFNIEESSPSLTLISIDFIPCTKSRCKGYIMTIIIQPLKPLKSALQYYKTTKAFLFYNSLMKFFVLLINFAFNFDILRYLLEYSVFNKISSRTSSSKKLYWS